MSRSRLWILFHSISFYPTLRPASHHRETAKFSNTDIHRNTNRNSIGISAVEMTHRSVHPLANGFYFLFVYEFIVRPQNFNILWEKIGFMIGLLYRPPDLCITTLQGKCRFRVKQWDDRYVRGMFRWKHFCSLGPDTKTYAFLCIGFVLKINRQTSNYSVSLLKINGEKSRKRRGEGEYYRAEKDGVNSI